MRLKFFANVYEGTYAGANNVSTRPAFFPTVCV